ncbi:MAG: hypothetical protein Q8L29_03740 [archaeon]|nr:hypothetical protein [archaeon]
MNKWLELFVGLIFVILAVSLWVMNYWGLGTAALEVLKGGLMWMILGLGALFILLGISDVKG